MKQYKLKQNGITLLITLLTMSVLLGVSTSLLNITLKQYQLSGIALSSEVAFQAANAGMECALYFDHVDNVFDVPGNGSNQAAPASLSCMGAGPVANSTASASGGEQRFQFTWNNSGSGSVCTELSVYKFYSTSATVPVMVDGVNLRPAGDCPIGAECTVVQSRGYNFACNQLTGARVVERELTQVY